MKYSVIHSLVVYQYSSHDIIQNLRILKKIQSLQSSPLLKMSIHFFETLTEIIHFLKLKSTFYKNQSPFPVTQM